MVAYKTIKRNKGAMTLAAQLSKEKFNSLNEEQQAYIQRTARCPDGITRDIIEATAHLLKKGIYPWGTSRRIYVDKPGRPGALRPITIPPFMDRVVQEAIRRVLESVYEPYFEKRNRSFGYRPGKGVHDCIYSLSRSYTNGFVTAIEGDIKAAYDRVCKDKLLDILAKKIKDRKFLDLIKQRLDYEYFDSVQRKIVKEKLGIPQGGIDSPYLWNIYMSEFDDYFETYTQKEIDKANLKVRGKVQAHTSIYSDEYAKIRWQKKK